MNRKSLLSLCLMCCVAVSTITCSIMPFGKSAKDQEPASQTGVARLMGQEEVGDLRKRQ